MDGLIHLVTVLRFCGLGSDRISFVQLRPLLDVVANQARARPQAIELNSAQIAARTSATPSGGSGQWRSRNGKMHAIETTARSDVKGLAIRACPGNVSCLFRDEDRCQRLTFRR